MEIKKPKPVWTCPVEEVEAGLRKGLELEAELEKKYTLHEYTMEEAVRFYSDMSLASNSTGLFKPETCEAAKNRLEQNVTYIGLVATVIREFSKVSLFSGEAMEHMQKLQKLLQSLYDVSMALAGQGSDPLSDGPDYTTESARDHLRMIAVMGGVQAAGLLAHFGAPEEKDQWLQTAAELGNTEALMYLAGSSLRKGDLEETLKWEQLAMDHGDQNAVYMIFLVKFLGCSNALEYLSISTEDGPGAQLQEMYRLPTFTPEHADWLVYGCSLGLVRLYKLVAEISHYKEFCYHSKAEEERVSHCFLQCSQCMADRADVPADIRESAKVMISVLDKEEQEKAQKIARRKAREEADRAAAKAAKAAKAAAARKRRKTRALLLIAAAAVLALVIYVGVPWLQSHMDEKREQTILFKDAEFDARAENSISAIRKLQPMEESEDRDFWLERSLSRLEFNGSYAHLKHRSLASCFYYNAYFDTMAQMGRTDFAEESEQNFRESRELLYAAVQEVLAGEAPETAIIALRALRDYADAPELLQEQVRRCHEIGMDLIAQGQEGEAVYWLGYAPETEGSEEFLRAFWEEHHPIYHHLGAYRDHLAVMTPEGTMLVGDESVCDADVWRPIWPDMVSVEANCDQIIGVDRSGQLHSSVRCEIYSAYRRIVDADITAGLQSSLAVVYENGTVSGSWSSDKIASWRGIAEVEFCGRDTLAARRYDGTCVVTDEDLMEEIASWEGVVQLAGRSELLLGLRSDGTILAAGPMAEDFEEVRSWTDIVQIAEGDEHVVGLRSDGTVVAFSLRDHSCADTGRMTDIVEIQATDDVTMGLRSDGTVCYAGDFSLYEDDAEFLEERWAKACEVASPTE